MISTNFANNNNNFKNSINNNVLTNTPYPSDPRVDKTCDIMSPNIFNLNDNLSVIRSNIMNIIKNKF